MKVVRMEKAQGLRGQALVRFRRQRGVTSIEYALIGTLVAVAIVGSVTVLGNSMNSLFTTVAKEVSNATGGK